MKHPALCFALAVAMFPSSGCGPPPFVERVVDHGELLTTDGVWIMRLEGTAQQRGRAAGELVGEQIRWALPRYLRATIHSPRPTPGLARIVASLRAAIPPAHLTQIEALAKSARVEVDTLLLVNLAPEAYAGMACSCMAAQGHKSATGEVVLARNLDWYGGEVLRQLGLVVVESVGGRRFASLTWPGIVGVVTGVSDRRLAVANLVVLGQKAQPVVGIPTLFAVRSMLEEADSAASAADWLERQVRTVPQNYILADPHGALVLETWRRRFRRRSPVDGFVAVGNLFDEDRGAHPRGRYVRMQQVGRAPTLGFSELRAGLQSVAMGSMTVQSAVIYPEDLVIYGATRARPASDGPFWRLELSAYLRPLSP